MNHHNLMRKGSLLAWEFPLTEGPGGPASWAHKSQTQLSDYVIILHRGKWDLKECGNSSQVTQLLLGGVEIFKNSFWSKVKAHHLIHTLIASLLGCSVSLQPAHPGFTTGFPLFIPHAAAMKTLSKICFHHSSDYCPPDFPQPFG